MGTFFIPNAPKLWDSTVMAQQVEGGAESWYIKYIPLIYYFPPSCTRVVL